MWPCVASCVLLALRWVQCCTTDTFFFACGGVLGHSDALIGSPVFVLGGKNEKLFNSNFRFGA